MGKGIAAHDGLVGLYRHVHQTRYHAAGRINLLRIDIGLDVDILMALDNHSHLFKRSIAGAFADTVDGHFHLTGTVQHAGHGVGGCHAQIVVTMRRYDGVVDAVYVLHQILYLGPIFRGQTVAGRIGNIHNGCSCFDDSFYHTGQVFILCTSRILSIKLHVIHKAAGVLYRCHRTFDDFLTIRVELIADM